MNNSGDAAEIIVRLYLEGFEEVVKLSGKGIKELVPLLASTLKQESKTKGKARLTQMIKSGSPLKVFTFKNKDLKKFTEQAKRYGVLYTVLPEKSAAKRDEVQIDKPTKSKGEIIVEQALAEPSEKKDNANENPDVAKTDKSPQSRQDSDKADMRTDKGNIKSAEKKPSVRGKLERYKAAGQKKEAECYQPEHTQECKTPAKNRQTKHRQPKKKYKAKHNRPKER